MKAIVKVVWSENEVPALKVATQEGYEYIDLDEDVELEYEVTDERRCVGYHSDRGEMKPCPGFREIDSGDQCRECRNKDIYTGWRTGNQAPEGGKDTDYSVYMAQCGEKVKVGVTRSSRLRTRWLEQGADYAAELSGSLTAEEALSWEQELSDKGLKERVRKENKLDYADRKLLESKMDEFDVEGEIEKVGEELSCSKLFRTGILPSPVEKVKGQIVSNGRAGMILTSGKTLRKPRQKGLKDF